MWRLPQRRSYMKQNKLDKAKPLLNRLLMHKPGEIDRKWRLYNSLAQIYLEKGRLGEAEKFAKRAYLGRERFLARDDNLLLESVDLLVHTYELQGKTDTVEALRRVHRAASIAASNGHLEVVKLLLASEETDRRALIGREKVLGVKHPDKLISVHDRPWMILYQGKYEAAEEMNRRSLKGYGKALGPDHTSTLTGKGKGKVDNC